MGFRFRRSIRLFPGVRVNLGKRGASLSVGRRGASLTFGRRGTYANVGLPGSGLSYRTRIGGKPAPKRQQVVRRAKPAPAAPAADLAIHTRLSLDHALAVQVADLKSGKPLAGKARRDFLKRQSRIVAGFLTEEATRRNEERRNLCDPAPLEEPAPDAASAGAASAPVTARLDPPPRSVSSRTGLDRIAAYRRRRSAALEAWASASARRQSAASGAGHPPPEEAVVQALEKLRRGDAPSFAVSVAVEPGALVMVEVVVGNMGRLPLSRLMAQPDRGDLAEQPLSEGSLAELVRLWALTVAGRCCDLLFLERGEVDRAEVVVTVSPGGAGAVAVTLARLALTKGEYVFDIGCGRNLIEGDLPTSVRISPTPQALLKALQPAAASAAADPSRSPAPAPSRRSGRNKS